MGKKVHPFAFRLGITRHSASRWFARERSQYTKRLRQDIEVRKFLRTKLRGSGIALVEVERSEGSLSIIIHTSRPGMVIGRAGAGVEDLKNEIKHKYFGSEKIAINISIQEVKQPDLSAEIILQGLVEQIEKRLPFRRVMKRGIETVIRAGGKGAKVCMSGRLNGADIARTEKLSEGKIPLHTLRADIDYARGIAKTTYGVIGVKVWIYKGEVFE